MSFEENIRKVVPYIPGEQPDAKGMIKLNTNECPYPPAPGIQKVLSTFQEESLRLYPDPQASSLVEELESYHQVKPTQVFVGVGSDDVIALAFLTVFNSNKPILFPDITYSFYEVWADLYRIPYETVMLDDDFHMQASDYVRENGGIIFPNPNAPTGTLEDLALIRLILESNPDCVVMVDEAYIDFGGKTCLELLPEYENLLIVRTFSKSRAMAGMRIGYAIGNEKLISYLQDVKFSFNSYTMSRLSLALGVQSVKEEEYFRESVERISKTRERVKKELAELSFDFPDSYGNFLFVTHQHIPAEELFHALKQEHIYVRYFKKKRIDNYLRITIGTEAEMDSLLQFLRSYIETKVDK